MRAWLAVGVAACALGTALPAHAASEVKIFRTESREAILQGTLEGVSVDPLGVLELARSVERLAGLDEPFVFSAAGHPEGWVIGTGNNGRVFKVDADGRVKLLFDAEEPEVFAVWADDDGTVFAGTSPDGKVYRLVDGRSEVVFDPPDTYIWDLARDKKGRLLVATGLGGRLYRVDKNGGGADVIYEASDSHVRTVRVLPNGDLLAGTAGQGLIVRLEAGSGTTTVTTLADAAQPEILSFAVRGDGGAYAAALASEASFVDLSKKKNGNNGNGKDSGGDDDVEVTVSAQSQETVGSRSGGDQGPRSVVFEISPDGRVEPLLTFEDETVHSLLWLDGELWIGTGQEGKLYRYAGNKLILERDLGERQIVGLVTGGAGAAAVATNTAAVYRIPGGSVKEGVYTSSVLDAGQVARFGSFRWEGDLPKDAAALLEVRSGLSLQPDATWTEWRRAGDTMEMPLADLAHGRYVQWRATFRGDGHGGPRWRAAELSYRQENLKPHIESFKVLDPGEILVPQSYNPQSQTFEPWSPNKEGIFTSLRPEKTNDDGRLKTLWKKGYRTVQWSAKDANDDTLEYAVSFRRVGFSGDWLPIVEELDDTYYSFDSTVLPDGVYRFRLTASDRPGQGDLAALSDEEISEEIVVDHTVPELVSKKKDGKTVEVELQDAASPLREVVYSIDAGEWHDAVVADGLLDGRREVARVEVPGDAVLVILRVTDAAFNVVTFDLTTP